MADEDQITPKTIKLVKPGASKIEAKKSSFDPGKLVTPSKASAPQDGTKPELIEIEPRPPPTAAAPPPPISINAEVACRTDKGAPARVELALKPIQTKRFAAAQAPPPQSSEKSSRPGNLPFNIALDKRLGGRVRYSALKWAIALSVVAVAAGLIYFKPWQEHHDLAAEMVAAAREELLTDNFDSPLGSLRVAAITLDGAQRLPFTNDLTVILRGVQSSLTITTNAGAPLTLLNLPAGEYAVSADVDGYATTAVKGVSVVPRQLAATTFVLTPQACNVRFICSETNTIFDVYQDGRKLGTTATLHKIEPFKRHEFVFKAKGWRDSRFAAQFDVPGKTYRCRVANERVAAGMTVAVTTTTGPLPTAGLLQINDSTPVKVTLPLKRQDLTFEGTLKLSLTVAGYKVLNNDQQILLRDRQTTTATFSLQME